MTCLETPTSCRMSVQHCVWTSTAVPGRDAFGPLQRNMRSCHDGICRSLLMSMIGTFGRNGKTASDVASTCCAGSLCLDMGPWCAGLGLASPRSPQH